MEFLALGIVLTVGGMLIGIYIGKRLMQRTIFEEAMGRLRIDHSEPDEPTRMFVELKGVTPDMIAQHSFVVFEVINESYISLN